MSGFGLLCCAFVIYKFYRLDPIDQELIINEQAINLTSQYTDNFRTYVHLDDFIQEIKMSNYFQKENSLSMNKRLKIQNQKL